MKALIVIFVACALLMILGGHYLLYESWIYFLHISDPAIEQWLLIALGVLAISFPATLGLVHWRENGITSWAYFFASCWLGIVWYIVLATVAVLLMMLVSDWFDIVVNISVVSLALLTIALYFSAYGFWSAQYPRIRRITVRMPNLPESWIGRTAVQLSDVHLGAIHHIKFARRVVNKVNKLRPDILFITGDIFDGAGRELGLLAKPFADITPPLGTYFIIGNHETYIGLDIVFKGLQEVLFTTLRDEAVDVDGVQVVGVDYHMPGKPRDVSNAVKLVDRAKPSIVLYHEPMIEAVDAFRAAGANLVLSGHTHKGQMWPFGYITKALFKRYDCGLYVDGNFTQFTSTGVGTWGPPMRVGNRPEIVQITFERLEGATA
ncbi:MAG: metallophosphoesterase [Patescibacteria group bacterium]